MCSIRVMYIDRLTQFQYPSPSPSGKGNNAFIHTENLTLWVCVYTAGMTSFFQYDAKCQVLKFF